MPKICYVAKEFSAERLALIQTLDSICQDWARQGYDLTLRQLYYQAVSRNIIENNPKEYAKLGDLVADARMAGLINWDHIVDRTRNLMSNAHWEKPGQLIAAAAKQYSTSKWENQPNYVECWIEKQALEGIIQRKCSELDVPFFACRGYTSVSEMWSAGQRLANQFSLGKKIHIVHLGDHDPSGIDMSRDIKARLDQFVTAHGADPIHVLRVALNMPQIERLNLPPNPAKLTDSRAGSYVEKYGNDSWELDALDPATLNDIVERAVLQFRNDVLWAEALALEARGRATLERIHEQFPDVVRFLRGEIL